MVDRTGLTDVDWAEINKLKRAHDAGGDAALSKALDELDKTSSKPLESLDARSRQRRDG